MNEEMNKSIAVIFFLRIEAVSLVVVVRRQRTYKPRNLGSVPISFPDDLEGNT